MPKNFDYELVCSLVRESGEGEVMTQNHLVKNVEERKTLSGARIRPEGLGNPTCIGIHQQTTQAHGNHGTIAPVQQAEPAVRHSASV
jgi:hypothetical protein|mmetsp:Transcript_49795/g.83456  ORF Transcript_49795/g.83456 Transcript_49795/m.83456 type:complete len:87 (+) Transcript_49795:1438-1698(+)